MAKTSLYGDRWHPTGETLAQGGQGQILWVTDGPGGARFLLKKLLNPARLGRFEAEVQALEAVKSDHIPKVVDYRLTEPAYFVTRHYGPTLESVVAEGRFSFDERIDLLRDVLQAIRDAHKLEITHRDVKPNNVVVSGSNALLIDFGICQFLDGRFMNTLVDEAMGNRSFAAPECELGAKSSAGPSADIYSFGKLVYWTLSGGHHLHRELITPEAIALIPEPRDVERPFVQRWLERAVTEDPKTRVSAVQLLAIVERDAQLMRRRIGAVGVPEPVCQVCGIGRMGRLDGMAIATLGLKPANLNPDKSLRVLQCRYCGWVRIHFIHQTLAEGLWE